MGRSLSALLGALVVASGAAAHADLGKTHRGTFLRLAAGPSYVRSAVDLGRNHLEFSGSGAALSVAIGGCVTDDLALHADFFGAQAVSITVKENGAEVASGGDTSLSSIGIGPGVTYYTPTNFYLGASLGIGRVSAREGEQKVTSDTGVGLDLYVGKEWWASDNWGLGLAGQLVVTSVPTRVNTKLLTTAVGVLFSATYN